MPSPHAVPGVLEIRTRPEGGWPRIPTSLAVRYGAGAASTQVDGGRIDATLRRFSPGVRVTRAYTSRAHLMDPGHGHLDWDEFERGAGLADTFRIELDPATDIHVVVSALRELESVVEATPAWLASMPAPSNSSGDGDRRVFGLVGAPLALDLEPGDATVVVAVIDSGVDATHPELIGRVRPGADTIDLVRTMLKDLGRWGRRDPTDSSDQLGDGTACAGILTAAGQLVPRGVAGACQVLPMRALTRLEDLKVDDSVAVGSIPDINAAVKLAVDLGAKVLNLSFGTPSTQLRPDDPPPHRAVIEYAVARGAIPVAATGNLGDETQYFPAALPEVLAVGSVDRRGAPSRFSCRGPHVDLCAPGERIPTLAVSGYGEKTGTSFAAPFVSGAAALIVAHAHRSALPVDVESVRRILVESARPFPPTVHGHGAGVLDVPGALHLLQRSSTGPPALRLFPSWRGPSSAHLPDHPSTANRGIK